MTQRARVLLISSIIRRGLPVPPQHAQFKLMAERAHATTKYAHERHEIAMSERATRRSGAVARRRSVAGAAAHPVAQNAQQLAENSTRAASLSIR